MSATPAWANLERDTLDAALERAKSQLDHRDYEPIALAVAGFTELLTLIDNQRQSLNRLRQICFGAKSEKSRVVLDQPPGANDDDCDGSAKRRKPPPKGHGRNPASVYTGAEHVVVEHPSLSPGHTCPHCEHGKLYTQRRSGSMVRITGQAPLGATCYALEKLRCNLCGELFTAPPPDHVSSAKYDESAATMIAVLKYGSGFPFNRLATLQRNLGVPLPASTQWDIVESVAGKLVPVYDELIRQGAHGELLHNDDTTMRVLELMDPQVRQHAFEDLDPERSGVFTSAIVSIVEQRSIVLFFTGPRHAGENLELVLSQRAGALEPPLQMCDALSRNLSPEFNTILSNCLAHGRRKFVDVINSFPDESQYVIETLGKVYEFDALAKNNALTPQQRLTFHQLHSAPLMNELHEWMTTQTEDKLVEPNSGLGQAIAYMLKHWHKLTRFLNVGGAPLDNNICERALKKAILHRKASLFFKTLNGARIGDLFMSITYTCQLAGINAFDYLNALQKHADELAANPQQWLPWNYRDTLARASPA